MQMCMSVNVKSQHQQIVELLLDTVVRVMDSTAYEQVGRGRIFEVFWDLKKGSEKTMISMAGAMPSTSFIVTAVAISSGLFLK